MGLIFDDGFERSSIKTAEIFESYGLRAVFAVLASPESFVNGCGDWTLWNELQQRGHQIQPHGNTHIKFTEVPVQQAMESIDRCLDSFQENLAGFKAQRALWAFTYNTSTTATVDYLLRRVRAVRIGGDPLLSDADIASRIWRSQTDGPHDPFDNWLGCINRARSECPAALFYCFHGLDGEYWGATSSDNLRRVLDIITSDSAFTYWDLSSIPPPSSPH